MRSAKSILFVVLAASMACQAAPRQKPIETSPIETGTGTTQAARKYLDGRWSLLSFEVTPPGAQPVAMKGSGMLLLDDFGNLRMELRADAASAALLSAAGIPIDDGVVMQEGRVVVDMQNRTLTYILSGDPPLGAKTGPLATNRPRHWQVEGNILTLTTKDESGAILSVGRWQKAQ